MGLFKIMGKWFLGVLADFFFYVLIGAVATLLVCAALGVIVVVAGTFVYGLSFIGLDPKTAAGIVVILLILAGLGWLFDDYLEYL